MSNEKSREMLSGTAKPSITDPLINTQNLALLHKRDRAATFRPSPDRQFLLWNGREAIFPTSHILHSLYRRSILLPFHHRVVLQKSRNRITRPKATERTLPLATLDQTVRE